MPRANDARVQQFLSGLTSDEKNSCIENNQLLELVRICKGGTISSMSRRKGRQERVSRQSIMKSTASRTQKAMTLKRQQTRKRSPGLPTQCRAAVPFSPLFRLPRLARLSPFPSVCPDPFVRIARGDDRHVTCSALRIAAHAAAEFDRFSPTATIGWSGLSQTDRFLRFDQNVINFPSNR